MPFRSLQTLDEAFYKNFMSLVLGESYSNVRTRKSFDSMFDVPSCNTGQRLAFLRQVLCALHNRFVSVAQRCALS